MCKHNWKVLSEVKTESKLEQLARLLNRVGQVIDFENMTSKKLIQIVTCEKCGKLKRFVTSY